MTTFAGKTIPPLFSPSGIGGSFFSSPFVLYDALYSYDGSNAVRQSIVWTVGSGQLETIVSPDLAQTPITSIPLQYHENLPIPPGTIPGGTITLSVRNIDDQGPEPFSFAAAPVGTWVTLVTTRQWQIARPSPGQTVFNVSVYEMSLTADTSTVLARATITIRYIRP